MSRWRIRKAAAALLATAAFALVAFAPAIALAAGTFAGGPDQAPFYVPNDHTPIAVHFTADAGSGLLPNTTYSMKVRFTVGTTPGGSTNRGFTWNPATQQWVQERDNVWTHFPTVTTDASGAVSSSSGWAFAKFGDDTKSGSYHLMISLSTGASSTVNGSIVPTVTLLDPRVDGSWVHNGVATGKSAATRAAVTDAASSTVFSLQKTEGQGVDDDANGVIDDEDWGPVGTSGDFHMSVPATTAIGINLNKATWTPGNGFVSGPADTDLAISAADTVAPSAPANLTIASHNASASIGWDAASDNTGVAGYYVYRWSLPTAGSPYSPVHSRVATLDAGSTTFVDTGLVNGATYYYEVRAFDAATNVGPRSATGFAIPGPWAAVTPVSPDGSDGWYLHTPSIELNPSAGRTCVYSFDASPSVWTTYTAPIEAPSGVSTLTYRDSDGFTMGATSTLDFKVDTSAPQAFVSAPAFSTQTSKSRTFSVSWSGFDAVSGVAAYDIEYKNGASGSWQALRTGTTATSQAFSAAAGANVYFRVRAHDVAGNVGEWSAIAGTIVPFDETKAKYSSSWAKARSSNYYLGSARYTTRKGRYATLSFTKGTLYLVTKTGPTMGKLAVYFAGKKVGTVNLHSATTKYRQSIKVLSRSTGKKAYTVKLVNLGVSGHKRVEIDGFALKN